MAVCPQCRADYIRGITVCPACGRELENDPNPEPPAAEGFVPFLTTGYPEGMAAAASLEAAGLETRLSTQDFHIYLAAPLYVTVLVRERDLDAASAALQRPPPAPPPPDPALCVICGAVASVHETERQGKIVSTTSYCIDHASVRIHEKACDSDSKVDPDVLEAVIALNARPGVRTVCSCSGSHPGAGEGFISLAPAGTDAASTEKFDVFVNGLQERIRGSEVASRVVVEWSAVHGAEINLVGRARARETWLTVARLIDGLPR